MKTRHPHAKRMRGYDTFYEFPPVNDPLEDAIVHGSNDGYGDTDLDAAFEDDLGGASLTDTPPAPRRKRKPRPAPPVIAPMRSTYTPPAPVPTVVAIPRPIGG